MKKPWTTSRKFSFIRSALRRAFMRWPANYEARNAVRRASQSSNPRLKWEFQCAQCGKWWPAKETHIHHIVPCGSLKDFKDLGAFAERLFVGADGLELLCKGCHKIKHKQEKETQ
jgi:5-methylcytosine-specific restriction endonuclease McrA